jgi:hypothetical protein
MQKLKAHVLKRNEQASRYTTPRQVGVIPLLSITTSPLNGAIPIMSYNLRTNARGRQGRRSNASVNAAEAEAEAESMDGVVPSASVEAGKHDTSKKKSLLGPRAGPSYA